MSLDKKIRYLFVALLCMAGFFYAFERPGLFWQLTATKQDTASTPKPDEQFGCWIGDMRGKPEQKATGSGQASEQTKSATDGEAPDWFKNLADTEEKKEPDADMIAHARQLQEEQWSREISKSPRARLLYTTISDARLPKLNINNAIITGATFINCELPDFTASGTTFKDVRFHQVKMDKARFTDCVFENCIFENTRLDRAILKKTDFKGGSFRMVATQTVRAMILPGIFSSTLDQVAFDGTSFLDAPISDADGEVAMRNLKEIKFKTQAVPLVSGAGLTLRLENSDIDGAKFATLDNSKIRISSCTFAQGPISLGSGAILVEHSTFAGKESLRVSGLALIRASSLMAAEVIKGKMYLADCELTGPESEATASYQPKFNVQKDGELNITGSSGDHMRLSNSGTVNISGLSLESLTMESPSREAAAALNLKDFSAKSAQIGYTRLKSCNWLNVDLPRVKLSGSKHDFGDIKLKNVTAPFLAELYGGKLPVTATPDWRDIKLPDNASFGF